MRIQHGFIVAIVAGILGWSAGVGFGKDEPPAPAQVIEMMREMGQPGPMHKLLDPMAGTWNVQASVFSPATTESRAYSRARWILGGRFMLHEYRGQMFGRPFTGIALMGYDNSKKHFESLWIDDFNAHMQHSTGKPSNGGKTLTFKGTWEGPNGMKSAYRMVYNLGDDGYTLTSYGDHGGNAVKEMELRYTRAKPAPVPTSAAAAKAAAPVVPAAAPATSRPEPAPEPAPAAGAPAAAQGSAPVVRRWCPPRPCRPRPVCRPRPRCP